MESHTPTRPLIAAIARREIDRVRPLLEQGVDPNATWFDGDKETALMVAAGFGFEEVVELLLAAGADASMRDSWGRTACIWAAEGHHVRLAERLWQAQTGRPPAKLTRRDLPPTQLDSIETPLTSSQEYLVLYAVRFNHHGKRIVRFMGLSADANRDAALQRISDDNNRMVETGPYLLCRRLPITDEPLRRPTNPLALSIESYRLSKRQLLVLAHLPTATTSPGRPISQQHDPWFRGWATIGAVFPEKTEARAREAALAMPGRTSLVQLVDVCTCYEGWVESHEGLVENRGDLQVSGEPLQIEPGIERGPAMTRPALQQTEAENLDSQKTDIPRPTPRPTASADAFYIRRGFEILRRFPVGFVAYTLLMVVLALVSVLIANRSPLWLLIAGTTLLQGPLCAGFFAVALAVAGGRPARFGDFFQGYRHIFPVLGLALIAWGLVFSTMMVPLAGIAAAYVGISSMYVLPLIIDRDLGLLPALAESWRLTHKRFPDSIFQCIVIILAGVAGIALFGIGMMVSLPWAGCILTANYKSGREISSRD